MLLLGGGKITTLSLLIYQQFNTTQDIGFAAAMGNVLMLAAIICFALQYRNPTTQGGIGMIRWHKLPSLPVAALYLYIGIFLLFIVLPIGAVVAVVVLLLLVHRVPHSWLQPEMVLAHHRIPPVHHLARDVDRTGDCFYHLRGRSRRSPLR